MKRKMAGLLAGVLACGLFTGCAFETDFIVNEDLSCKMNSRMLYTEEELRLLYGESFEDERIQEEIAKMQTTIKDGVHYYFEEETGEFTKAEIESQNVRIDEKCVAFYTDASSLQSLSGEEEEQLNEMINMIHYMKCSVEVPFVIATSNADSYSNKHMEFDFDIYSKDSVIYAVRDVSLLEGKDLKLLGVTSGDYYQKDRVVTVTTKDGLVELYEAKRDGEPVVFGAPGNPYNQFCTTGDGRYTVSATLISGTKKSVTFTVDGTVPKCNLKNGGSYKSGKKITFSDATSGVKTATLDGKKVKSGKKVTGKGAHKLVITDKAGNKTTVKFNIK